MIEKLHYSEAEKLESWDERFSYLKLDGLQHQSPRYMSNGFYKSPAWMRVRNQIIVRDLGCDLGILGLPIDGPIIVHHINPLTPEDIENWNEDKLFNPDNLISCSVETHNKIHYNRSPTVVWEERKPNDTTLWR